MMNPLMKLIGFTATLVLLAIIPVYALKEPSFQGAIMTDMRTDSIVAAADMYAENCVVCHGASGEGIGTIPVLDSEALRTIPAEELHKIISRGVDNTQMAAWNVDEGGIFTYQQISDLVTMVLNVDWNFVEARVMTLGLMPPQVATLEITDDMLATISSLEGGETLAAGITVYAENCAACHAANGGGTTIAPALNTDDLRAKPNEDLLATINNGVSGSLMASWKDTLSVEQIDAVIAFLERWPEVESSGVAFPEIAVPAFESSPELVPAGDKLFHIACKSCHGVDGYGSPMAPSLNNPTFLADTPDAAIYQIIYGGVPDTLMPTWGVRLSDEEIRSLVAFIRSLETSTTPILQP
jgi:mono/diheme cytochrome c family protein